MGVIGNLLLSTMIERREQRSSGLSRRLFGFMKTLNNTIVCGGSSQKDKDTRLQFLMRGIEVAALQGIPAVFLYDPKSVHMSKPLYQNIVMAGRDFSLIPFEENMDPQIVKRMFSQMLNTWNPNHPPALESLIEMLIQILYHGLGKSYLTWPNMAQIVSHLVIIGNQYNDSQNSLLEFMNWAKTAFHLPNNFFQNQLSNQWTLILTSFFEFWNECLRQFPVTGNDKSVLSCLYDHQICLIPADQNKPLLQDVIACSLLDAPDPFHSIFGSYLTDCSFLTKQPYQPLQRINMLLILERLEPENLLHLFSNVSFICLGLSQFEAEQVLEAMVYKAHWIETTLGFAPGGGFMGISRSTKQPITTSDLSYSSLRNGRACVLSKDGYQFIQRFYG